MEEFFFYKKDIHFFYQAKFQDKLNEKYDCHIKIFGTECWKKLSRLSIAIAGYTVSTDDTFNNIVVTKEHVDYAYNMFIELYDNPVFRLKEYVENERKYNCIDDAGVRLLQELYIKLPQLLIPLSPTEQIKLCMQELFSTKGSKQNLFQTELAKTKTK